MADIIIHPDYNNTTSAGMEQDDFPSGLTDAQDKLLALLPIPSSILSVIGSSIIIYIILHNRGVARRRWTPYSRLLLAMSICDIVSSISIAIAGFLRPQGSIRAWAFGNEATCTISGFLIQFSWSGMLYYNMLSLYFLLSTRFGMKNTTIGRRIEPFMHVVAVGYPLVTGIVGAIMDVYSETTASFGCWVNDYPRGCTDNGGVECKSVIIGWIFQGMPFSISALMLISNNIAIFVFVTNQVKSRTARPSGQTTAHPAPDITRIDVKEEKFDVLANNNVPEPTVAENKSQKQDCCAPFSVSFSQSIITDELSGKSRTNSPSHQIKRLRLVRSQALLFVFAFTLSVAWGAGVNFIESLASTKAEEISMAMKYFPVLVGNAIFAPLAGFLNMMVFLRPKYLRWKHKNPQNKNLRDFWRNLFESTTSSRRREKTPTGPPKPAEKKGHAKEASLAEKHGKGHDDPISPSPRPGISSLTMSLQSAAAGIQERQSGRDSDGWISSESSVCTVNSSGHFEDSGLEVISEITSSVFDNNSANGGSISLDSDIHSSSSDIQSSEGSSNTTLSSHPEPPVIEHSLRSEDRWSSSTSPRLVHPKRFDESPQTPKPPVIEHSLRSEDRWSSSTGPRLVRTNWSGVALADETPKTPSRRRERLCRWSSNMSSESSLNSNNGGVILDSKLPMPKRDVSEIEHQDNDVTSSQTVPVIPSLKSIPPPPSE